MEGVPTGGQNNNEKRRDNSIETQLFGVSIEKGSPLNELYRYFSSDDMQSIATDFNFHWGEFHLVETVEQFEKLVPLLTHLGGYAEKRPTKTNPYAKPEEVKAFKEPYKLILRSLVAKIDEVTNEE